MITKEIRKDKNSHDKFVLTVNGETVRIALYDADGKGGFKATRNAFAFDRKHLGKLRALLAEIGGAK